MIIFRLDAPLYYFNASVADKQIRGQVSKTMPPPQAILIDLSATADLDIVSADMLHDLVVDLREQNIQVLFSQVRGSVRDRMRRTGLMEDVGEERVFMSIDAAVQNFLQSKTEGNEPPIPEPA